MSERKQKKTEDYACGSASVVNAGWGSKMRKSGMVRGRVWMLIRREEEKSRHGTNERHNSREGYTGR